MKRKHEVMIIVAALILIVFVASYVARATDRRSPIDNIPKPVLWEMEPIVRMAIEQVGREWKGHEDARQRWDMPRSGLDYKDWRNESIHNPGDPEVYQKAARIIGDVLVATVLAEKERK